MLLALALRLRARHGRLTPRPPRRGHWRQRARRCRRPHRTRSPSPTPALRPAVFPACKFRKPGSAPHYVRWSPDGSRILFDLAVGKRGAPPVGLYMVDVDGNQVREVLSPIENAAFSDTLGTYTGSMIYFDISPDGSRVAYSTCRHSTDANFELMVSDLDGTETRRLTNDAHVDNYPVWSPDGSRIAFISSRAEEPGHDPRNYRLLHDVLQRLGRATGCAQRKRSVLCGGAASAEVVARRPAHCVRHVRVRRRMGGGQGSVHGRRRRVRAYEGRRDGERASVVARRREDSAGRARRRRGGCVSTQYAARRRRRRQGRGPVWQRVRVLRSVRPTRSGTSSTCGWATCHGLRTARWLCSSPRA